MISLLSGYRNFKQYYLEYVCKAFDKEIPNSHLICSFYPADATSYDARSHVLKG